MANQLTDNTIFLSGDSHLNWVSDLTWLDKADYNPETGEGGVGVEFAGVSHRYVECLKVPKLMLTLSRTTPDRSIKPFSICQLWGGWR